MDATEAVKGGTGRGGVGLGGDAHGFWRLKVAWEWVGDTESYRSTISNKLRLVVKCRPAQVYQRVTAVPSLHGLLEVTTPYTYPTLLHLLLYYYSYNNTTTYNITLTTNVTLKINS